MVAPFFSSFSAVTELGVTIVVMYVVISAMGGGPFRPRLAFGVVIFEVAVNVSYMTLRSAEIGLVRPVYTTFELLLAAVHGFLSLGVLVALVLIFVVAYHRWRKGVNFMAKHKISMAAFIVVWLVSVGSGELLYAMLYMT